MRSTLPHRRSCFAISLVCALGGCSGSTGPEDAGLSVSDAGPVDAGGLGDAGPEDGGVADAGDCAGGCGVRAGAVSTWLAASGAGDDLTLHPDGYLVASDPIGEGTYSAPTGVRLLRIDFDGTTSELTRGLRKPLGNTVGPDGSLYACEWGAPTGSVFRVAPDGAVSEIAQDIQSPSNVVVLDDGAVLVTAWGTNEVLRIPPEGGAPTRFAALPRPVGMDRDANGAVVVASADGHVYRLGSDGAPTEIARVEDRGTLVVADLVAAHGGLYATSFSGHRIWRITDAGRAEVFAGTGTRGGDDGPGLLATFNTPNGIAASADGRTLYVQQLLGALRVIPILD